MGRSAREGRKDCRFLPQSVFELFELFEWMTGLAEALSTFPALSLVIVTVSVLMNLCITML